MEACPPVTRCSTNASTVSEKHYTKIAWIAVRCQCNSAGGEAKTERRSEQDMRQGRVDAHHMLLSDSEHVTPMPEKHYANRDGVCRSNPIETTRGKNQ